MADTEIAFVFEYDNRLVQLPITPEDIEIQYPGNNKTANIIAIGEVSLLKSRKLATFSIKSWFPDEDWYPGIRTRGNFENSKFYVDFFEKIRTDKKPCWLYIYGLNFNMQVSIESFTHQRKGGEHEDLYYTLGLKEYRPFSVRELPKIIQEESGDVLETLDKKTPILEPTDITVGTTVVVNGKLHRDSYGSNPGKTLSNYTGRVSLINKKGSHPYHIINSSGGWLGWVNKESVSIASEQITGLPMASRPQQSSSPKSKSTTTDTNKNSSVTSINPEGIPKLDLKKFVADVKASSPSTQDVANSKGKEKTENMNKLLDTYKILMRTGEIYYM